MVHHVFTKGHSCKGDVETCRERCHQRTASALSLAYKQHAPVDILQSTQCVYIQSRPALDACIRPRGMWGTMPSAARCGGSCLWSAQ